MKAIKIFITIITWIVMFLTYFVLVPFLFNADIPVIFMYLIVFLSVTAQFVMLKSWLNIIIS